MVTVAFGTTAPVESLTVPAKLPRSPWASAGPAVNARNVPKITYSDRLIVHSSLGRRGRRGRPADTAGDHEDPRKCVGKVTPGPASVKEGVISVASRTPVTEERRFRAGRVKTAGAVPSPRRRTPPARRRATPRASTPALRCGRRARARQPS